MLYDRRIMFQALFLGKSYKVSERSEKAKLNVRGRLSCFQVHLSLIIVFMYNKVS